MDIDQPFGFNTNMQDDAGMGIAMDVDDLDLILSIQNGNQGPDRVQR